MQIHKGSRTAVADAPGRGGSPPGSRGDGDPARWRIASADIHIPPLTLHGPVYPGVTSATMLSLRVSMTPQHIDMP
jgi:hypothetical protein